MSEIQPSDTLLYQNTDRQLTVLITTLFSSLVPMNLRGDFVKLSIGVGNSEILISSVATPGLLSTLRDIATALLLCRKFIVISRFVPSLSVQNFLLSVLSRCRPFLMPNCSMEDIGAIFARVPLESLRMFQFGNVWKIDYFPKFKVLLTSLILSELHCIQHIPFVQSKDSQDLLNGSDHS